MLILIRHGEAEHNIERLFDSSIISRSHLTVVGIQQVINSTNLLKELFKDKYYKVSRIFCSPLLRTIETARIFKEIMKENELYRDDRFCIDYRLREIEMGDFDRVNVNEYPEGSWNFGNNDKYGGECTFDVQKRSNEFLDNLNPFNINVVITHGEVFRRMLYKRTKIDMTPLRGQAMIIEDITNNIIFNTHEFEEKR